MIAVTTSPFAIRPLRVGPFTDPERRRNPGASLCEILPNKYSFYIKPHNENARRIHKYLLNSFLRLCEFCQIAYSTRQNHKMNQKDTNLKSQSVTSNHVCRRLLPYAFTEGEPAHV